MNVQLKDVTVIARDGQVSAADTVFLQGSHIRFVVVPDNLRHARFSKLPGPFLPVRVVKSVPEPWSVPKPKPSKWLMDV